MADEQTGSASPEMANGSEDGSRKTMLLRILVALLLLGSLIVFGFFFGIYLRLFDVHQVNETMRLYNLPVFGEYFVKPPETGKL